MMRQVLSLVFGGGLLVSPFMAQALDYSRIENINFDYAHSQYQQGEPLSAMAHLMSAAKLGLLGSEQAAASLFLAQALEKQGLLDEALTVYRQVVDIAQTADLSDMAQLGIARLKYQQGDSQAALAALTHIKKTPGGAGGQEYAVIQAHAYLDGGELKRAVKALPKISGESLWAMYQYFNIGVELLEVHRSKHGAVVLHRLSQLASVEGAEREAIRDQACLALGFALLKLNKPAKARVYFDKVRLDSHLSGIALLGMGWAYAQSQDYEKALVYWLELQQRASNNAYSYESLLAVPYAYNKAGAYSQAIEQYKMSQMRIDDELAKLARARQSIASGGLLAMVSQSPESEYGWIKRMSDMATLEARVMPLLMANPDFQQSLMEYRQLLRLQQHVLKMKVSLADLKALPVEYSQGPDVAALKQRYKLLSEQLRWSLDAHQQELEQRALETLSRYEVQLESYVEQARFGLAQAIESGVMGSEGAR